MIPCWCDEPRPCISGPTVDAIRDLHRALHDLGRALVKPLFEWIVK